MDLVSLNVLTRFLDNTIINTIIRRNDESYRRSHSSRIFETERKHARQPGGHSSSEAIFNKYLLILRGWNL